MYVVKRHFPSILTDNEENYFMHIEALIESVDELASVIFRRGVNSYSVRIAPSLPKYSQMILQELLTFHNLLKLRVELSKSIRNTSTIEYSIQEFKNK